MTTDQSQPVTDPAAAFNQDQPAVKDKAQTHSQDKPKVLNQTRALVDPSPGRPPKDDDGSLYCITYHQL